MKTMALRPYGANDLRLETFNQTMTAIADFDKDGKSGLLFAELARIVKGYNGLWNVEVE